MYAIRSYYEILLHPPSLVVRRAFEKAVRPATDIRLFVDARAAQRVVRDESVCGSPVVELDEPGRRKGFGRVVGHDVSVADQAFTERFRIVLLGRDVVV